METRPTGLSGTCDSPSFGSNAQLAAAIEWLSKFNVEGDGGKPADNWQWNPTILLQPAVVGDRGPLPVVRSTAAASG
jgi:hypothetical protein